MRGSRAASASTWSDEAYFDDAVVLEVDVRFLEIISIFDDVFPPMISYSESAIVSFPVELVDPLPVTAAAVPLPLPPAADPLPISVDPLPLEVALVTTTVVVVELLLLLLLISLFFVVVVSATLPRILLLTSICFLTTSLST